MNDVQTRILRFIEQHQLMDMRSKVMVALSGGADSVALLRLLLSAGYHVEAAHCNFQLRGEESMRDEKFVTNLCRSMSVPLHTTRFDTRNYAESRGISIEMAARELRYDYFEQLRTSLDFDCIAVAHHRDDNIETVLLNLVRGTGIKGLTGMQPRNGHIVRPFLCVTRAEIMDYLDQIGQPFITDSTNLDAIYNRNKVRLDIMPLIRSINAGADSNIETTIANMQEAYKVYEHAISMQAASCLDSHASGPSESDTLYIYINRLASLPSPISVLHHILSPLGFNRTQLYELVNMHDAGRSVYSPTHRALIDRHHIIVAPKVDYSAQSVVPLGQCKTIDVVRMPKSAVSINPDPNYAYIDVAKVHGSLTVRHLKEGDVFYPFGMKGRKLVSDYLTDLKLSRMEKESQVVVADDCDIVWVVGRRSSERHRIDDDTSEVLVLKQK